MKIRKYHGCTYHPLYSTWRGMISRCKYPTVAYYDNYGGRGIRVCEEWLDAATFIEWAKSHGWKTGLQIDRIDNDGDYCPENCQFVTRKENCQNARHNRMITFNGITMSMAGWSDRTGIGRRALQHRISRGWSVERALTEPIHTKDVSR